jgi:hypothetical protein
MSLPIKAFLPREVRQVIEKVNQHKAPGFAYCSICRVDCKFARNKKKLNRQVRRGRN